MAARRSNRIESFRSVLRRAGTAKKHLLLGNGFSLACRSDIFSYGALFDRADFRDLAPVVRNAFDALGTRDFEKVIDSLRKAAALVRLYSSQDGPLVHQLQSDANSLREVLARAIAQSHPENPNDIRVDAYQACRRFLNNFSNVYTLSYDLLLYWAIMQQEIEPSIRADDGFRTPSTGEAGYVTWEIEKTDKQNVFYMHGALHLYDTGSELLKYTWINTGIRLIDQVREALSANRFPLIVAEGSSLEKLDKIMHSSYLSRGYRSFSKIGGTLFVYGLSMSENDEHILRLIEKNKVSHLFVSLHGNPNSQGNRHIIRRSQNIANVRPRKRPLEIGFYDADSASVWG